MRLRAERIGALHERLYLAAETELSAVLAHVEQVNPTLLILDSVQTVRSPASTAPTAAPPRSGRWPARSPPSPRAAA